MKLRKIRKLWFDPFDGGADNELMDVVVCVSVTIVQAAMIIEMIVSCKISAATCIAQ